MSFTPGMLPAEVLADSIGFHKLFDLSSLLLTNLTFSNLAVSAATHLRVWRIPYLRLIVHPKFIILKTTGTDPVSECEAHERIVMKKRNASELIGIALANCIFDKLSVHFIKMTHSDDVIEAIRRAASSVVVNKLMMYGKCYAHEDDAIALAESFYSIRELSVDTTVNRDAAGTKNVILGHRARASRTAALQP